MRTTAELLSAAESIATETRRRITGMMEKERERIAAPDTDSRGEVREKALIQIKKWEAAIENIDRIIALSQRIATASNRATTVEATTEVDKAASLVITTLASENLGIIDKLETAVIAAETAVGPDSGLTSGPGVA